MNKLKVGMLLFPDVTIQDFIGPYEVFTHAPDCFEVWSVGESTRPLQAEGGLTLQPALSFADCPPVDILFAPGGRGINAMMQHSECIAFLQRQAATAKYITSVCTGSLLLGAAGLLKGYRAATHWRYRELLGMLGAEVVHERVVVDRNRITGGGITAGIDFGLTLTAIAGGEDLAKTVQLLLEYAPAPPFQCGTPATADAHIVQQAEAMTQAAFDYRKQLIAGLKK